MLGDDSGVGEKARGYSESAREGEGRGGEGVVEQRGITEWH